jgi:hypothetical protein
VSSSDRKAMALGWFVIGAPIAVIGILASGPPEEPEYETPVEQVQTWTPEPAPLPAEREEIVSSYGPEQDCGDGTRGTFGECWQRLQEEALAEAARSAAAQPSPSDWPTFSMPVATPSLAPPAVTVCADGSISHSTGRGTCSWHGGIAP